MPDSCPSCSRRWIVILAWPRFLFVRIPRQLVTIGSPRSLQEMKVRQPRMRNGSKKFEDTNRRMQRQGTRHPRQYRERSHLGKR
jgi:hypothetical protein